mmetsp:Transcript_26706/g.103799  ORF Transcript_26706/g.103799 Transcript_26706/m.103799 type:complete len:340 (+) Transcript_26706:4615-5634(+)
MTLDLVSRTVPRIFVFLARFRFFASDFDFFMVLGVPVFECFKSGTVASGLSSPSVRGLVVSPERFKSMTVSSDFDFIEISAVPFSASPCSAEMVTAGISSPVSSFLGTFSVGDILQRKRLASFADPPKEASVLFHPSGSSVFFDPSDSSALFSPLDVSLFSGPCKFSVPFDRLRTSLAGGITQPSASTISVSISQEETSGFLLVFFNFTRLMPFAIGAFFASGSCGLTQPSVTSVECDSIWRNCSFVCTCFVFECIRRACPLVSLKAFFRTSTWCFGARLLPAFKAFVLWSSLSFPPGVLLLLFRFRAFSLIRGSMSSLELLCSRSPLLPGVSASREFV